MKPFAAAALLLLTVAVIPARAADGPDAADAATPNLAADVDWGLPAVQVGGGATVGASRGSVLPSLYASLAALEAYDGYSTTSGLRRGATEGNGVMKNVAANPAAMWMVKAGVTTASIVVAERLWKQNRRVAAIATMVATNGLMAAVAARNASVLRAQR